VEEKDKLCENEFLTGILKAAEIVASNCKAKKYPFLFRCSGQW